MARTREQTQSDSNSLWQVLIAQGLIVPQHSTTRANAEHAYPAYLERLGDRHLGFTQAMLEDRVR